MALTKISRGLLNTGVSDGSDATAITIDSSENVGIGETSPDLKLHVKSSGQIAKLETTASTGDCILTFADASANKGFVGFGSSSSEIFQVTNIENGDMKFDTNNTERMRIDSSGKVGIGDTSPDAMLKVVSNSATVVGSWVRGDYYGLRVSGGSTSSHYALRIANSSDSTLATFNGDGSVGIGTHAPNAKFHLATADSTTFSASTSSWHTQVIKNDTGATSNASGLAFYTSANGYHVNAGTGIACVKNGTNSDYGAHLVFITRPQAAIAEERMRILDNGTVTIGMTSDNYLAADDGIQLKAAGNIRIGGSGTSARNVMSFVNNTGGTPAEVGYIQTSGSGTAYGTSSDYRLKENVVDMDNAINRVKELKPKRFNFIVDADKTVDGFLAHEVSDIVPEAISGTKDAIDDEGNPIYQGIDQSKLVPLLTKAIQELSAKVEELEKKV